MALQIPPRGRGERGVTEKQVEYLLHLAPEIPELEIRRLGKWQASALIDQIKTHAHRSMASPPPMPRPPRPVTAWEIRAVLILIAFFAVAILISSTHPKQGSEAVEPEPSAAVPATPAPTPRAPATPRPVPNSAAAIQAQKRATLSYPDLARANSPLNKRFVEKVRAAQTERPEIFDDPEWPTILAKEARASLPP